MFKSLFIAALFSLTSSAFATTLTPVDKFNKVKVIGHWKQYNVYDVDSADLSLDIPPFMANSIAFQSDLTLADAITPIDEVDINKNGVKCSFLCVNPNNQVIGYNPVAYANSRAMQQKAVATLKVSKKK